MQHTYAEPLSISGYTSRIARVPTSQYIATLFSYKTNLIINSFYNRNQNKAEKAVVLCMKLQIIQ